MNLSPLPPIVMVFMSVFFITFKFSQMCFILNMTTPILHICLPSTSLLPLLLIISLALSYLLVFSFAFSLYFHFSARLLARTCVHHQRILATCYLITQARATLKTSLAEQTQAKHQSARYATKANHTTRTIRHGEFEELIQSLTEALFT